VLFDGMQLLLEHSVLSDVLFNLVLLTGLVVLGWCRTPRVRVVAVAGFVLGLAVLVRLVAQPVVLPAALFCLLTGVTLRHRLLTAAVVCVAFVAPLAAYATWYHQVNGVWALSEASSRALYMRTTTFVDCDRIEVPEHQRRLCPPEPIGDRLDPTQYGWHRNELLEDIALDLPTGTTMNDALQDFALTAIRTQPGDYVQTVLRDFWSGFSSWERVDHFEYDTAYKWSFEARVDYEPTEKMSAAYLAYGGDLPRTRHPVGDWVARYGEHVYVRGPILLLLALLGIAGLVVGGAATLRASRPLIFLTGSVALGLVLVPDVTAQFVWRYQLPALVLLPISAALGWTRIRAAVRAGGQGPPRHRAPTARRGR
jgi:4-amino-4-deoxy-L-arabinose transferase-like glycosyltransferase